MAKLPAIQFYPGDWRKDVGVQALTFHDRGVWFEILMLMHESERRGVLTLNGMAMPDDALARLLGLDKQILTTTITNLLTYGVASREEDTGALVCRRMIRDEKLRQTRAECGKLGGNPDLLKQNPTTQVKQNSTPSSSSSVSSSTSKQKPKLVAFTLPEWVDTKAWDGYMEVRKKKRAYPTDDGKGLLVKKLDSLKRAGHDPTAVLNQSIENSYQGLFELKPTGATHGTPIQQSPALARQARSNAAIRQAAERIAGRSGGPHEPGAGFLSQPRVIDGNR